MIDRRLLLVEHFQAVGDVNVMSDDYFGDASDADFLALAQQLDKRGNPTRENGTGNSSSANTTTRAPAPKLATSTLNTSKSSVERRQSEASKTNQTTPRVLRPGFNAVIVNTRQVKVLDINN
jgi:hypothetical protein